MVVSVVFRRQADADIEAIADYIAIDNPGGAVAWAEALRAHCLSLGEFPERAPIYASDIRRTVSGAYLIFYRLVDKGVPDRTRVIVLRILHSAMDVSRVIDPEDD